VNKDEPQYHVTEKVSTKNASSCVVGLGKQHTHPPRISRCSVPQFERKLGASLLLTATFWVILFENYSSGEAILGAQIRHLTNAPIVEAVVDFKFETPSGISDSISEVVRLLTDRLPNVSPIKIMEGKIDLKGKEKFETRSSVVGNRMDADGKVAQIFSNQISFSKLAPYETYDSLIQDARYIYETYIKVVPDVSIKRIALRYINKVGVGENIRDLGDYISYPPTIPKAMHGAVASCFQRIQIESPHGIMTNFIQSLEKPSKDKEAQAVIDIDAYKLDIIDATTVWSDFQKLREHKNEVFFDSITEKTAERYA
jgi:uncharacterized protein (TIGR04255 family)